ITDPVQRLGFVKDAMDDLKDSKQALGVEMIASAQNFAPPTLLAQASRLNFSTRLFNLIVTNVPGPQFPLYVLGRRMLAAYPVAFLPERHALAIAIMSYNGQMNFGLLGDFDALPDIESVGEHIKHELAELLERAAETLPASNGAKASKPRPRTRSNGRGRLPAGAVKPPRGSRA
ncbi:MAG TPA: WSD1 family O-acyltransferase, partial [Solirubrobacteraceae bacterium]|nr:WSD1 family O-acyltransferase [Solirubrobacteraceae bacterium]